MATYTVKAGDTLYDIAKNHGTTYQEIAKANGIDNPNLIYAGQTLNIGEKTTSTPKATDTTGTAGGTPAETAPTFSYTPSDAVTQAEALLQQQLANKPGEYQSAWQTQLNDTLQKILNREKFSYDLNGDMLYQQYKDQFTTQGKLASMDVAGQAAAMTGGYGNSYAQTVGQQAYQGYLQQLNDKVPELYQLALNQYNAEGDDMYKQASLMAQMEDQDYGRYRDTVSDYYTDLNYLTENARYMSETEYQKALDDFNIKYASHRDTVADNQWQASFDEGVRQYDEQFKYKQEQDKIANDLAWQQLQASLSGGSGGGDGGDGGSDFKKAVFSRVDDNGNYVFYIDGKERIYAPGVNPYTGTKNSDIEHGAFDNGYQPNNVNGKKLTKTGITDVVNGVTQNVWKTPDGKLWIWDGTKNKYLEYDDGNTVKPGINVKNSSYAIREAGGVTNMLN